MLSPQLRNKVHNLWSLFWTAGIANPLSAIEQITYLLFIRQLEGLDRERVRAGKKSIYAKRPDDETDYEQCRWSYIRQNPSFTLLNEVVFPWLRGLEGWLREDASNGHDRLRQAAGRLSDAYFILDTNKTDTLIRAVGLIDDLFRHLDTRSVNSDIMGDIFEHLLDEVKESGKNGQFRTPRHLIRFMVELLEPQLGASVIDPACGSGGFLLNTLLYWRAQHTDPEVLKLEWDGTPHDIRPVWPRGEQPDFSSCFRGYDNDRTMVRIAWMNLLLHDIAVPSIWQLDSLSKRLPDEESNTFDYVLANPPFTGSVDEGDLSANRERFPAGKGNKPITTKSELLFAWLILDLLRRGGRAAVVVPDGLLFGNSLAHRELRRHLLFENTLEAVISVPANMFQPYSGVKTSILIFQKARTSNDSLAAGEPPRTREVWFYEIEEEAYTLDQKRKARFAQENDMWDALAKFLAWKRYLDGQAEATPENSLRALRDAATSTDYWQPEYWEERWRNVDYEFLRIFPEKEDDKGHTFSLHEIWNDLPRDPREAEKQVVDSQRVVLEQLFSRYCVRAAQVASATSKQPTLEKAVTAAEKTARDLANRIIRLVREEGLLDRDFDQFGLNALRPVLDEMRGLASSWASDASLREPGEDTNPLQLDEAVPELRAVIREFARLDGYNIWRRSGKVLTHPGKLRVREDGTEERVPARKSWVVPVRVWAQRETWGTDPETGEEIEKSTHDGGLVRLDYIEWLHDALKVFEADGTIKKDYLDRLDPECLEALDFNLLAGRHKPFTFDAEEHRPPEELIGELDDIYAQIRERLSRLMGLMGGRA